MPSVSKKQQKFMGIVRSIQKGEQPAGKFSKDAQKAAKKMKKSSVKKYAKTKHDDLPVKKESYTSNMMKAVRKGGTAGPWDIIISKNNKIVKRVSVKNLKEIPAYMDDIKKKFPNHKIGIESKGGKIVYREAVVKVSKKDDIPGNPMKMKGEEKIKKLVYSGSINNKGSYEIKGNKLYVNNIRPRDKGFFVRHFTMGTGFRKANLYYDGVHWQGGKKF